MKDRQTFTILDMHGEYRDLLRHFAPEDLLWLTADDIGLNPFEVPRRVDRTRTMSPDKWAGRLKEWLRTNWLNDPSVNRFAACLVRLYRDRGVLDGGDDYPCLSDVIEALENQDVQRNSDAAKAREKLLDRLSAMRSMLPGLDVRTSRDIHELFRRRSAIIDLVDLSDVALPLFFGLLATVFTCAFEAEPGEPARHLLVLEEAHTLLGGHIAKRTADLGESRGLSLLRSLRKAGFCGCVVSQLVSDLDPAVLGNLSSLFCLRLVQSRCIAQAASAVGLEPWQRRELGVLPAREAIVRLSGYPHPIHLAVAHAYGLAGARSMSREEARLRSQSVLARIPFVPRPADDGHPESDAGGDVGSGAGSSARDRRPQCTACRAMGLTLQRDEHRVMTDICEAPASSIPERNDRLGMPREEESVARRALMRMGVVVLSASVGNRRLLFEPSAKGRQWADLHGVAVPRCHASFVHEYIRRIAEEKLSQAAPGTSYLHRGTGEPGGVRADSIALLPGRQGRRFALQAVFAHHPGGEAANLLKLCGERPDGPAAARERNGAGWIDLVLSIAANKRVRKSVENAVKRLNGGRLPGNLVFLDAEALMDPAYDLAWILERPT